MIQGLGRPARKTASSSTGWRRCTISPPGPEGRRGAGAAWPRFNQNRDTPLPPEEPRGENPPAGALLDYVLPSGARSVAGVLTSLASDLESADAAPTRAQIDLFAAESERLAAR